MTIVLPRTLGDGTGEREPFTPLVFGSEYGVAFKNRGPGGPPAWAWRGEDGSFGWEDGEPPVPCGGWFEA